MNFDKLPNEIKRMIFDKNRDVMESVRKRNFEMVQVELKMLFQDEEYPWCEVKPSEISTWKDKEPDDQLEMYYYLTNREILPVDKFVRKYMTGIHPRHISSTMKKSMKKQLQSYKKLNNGTAIKS